MAGTFCRLGLLADVALDEVDTVILGISYDGRDGGLGTRSVHVGDDDRGACAGPASGHGGAEAGRAACDEDMLAGEGGFTVGMRSQVEGWGLVDFGVDWLLWD